MLQRNKHSNMTFEDIPESLNPLHKFFDSTTRTLEFWRRAGRIYLGYKHAQVRDFTMRHVAKKSDIEIEEQLWKPHHSWAGEEMYRLAVDLRGFYLKTGQFVGARGDFVPSQICQKLTRLHDKVPPMDPARARAEIERELGSARLDEVFDWVDFEPLGSASISQVHKAKLRKEYRLIEQRKPWFDVGARGGGGEGAEEAGPSGRTPEAPVGRVAAEGHRTDNKFGGRIVALKIQYPNALRLMELDLMNIRSFAAFLSKTELKFDLVSAVDELATQIRLEFDFKREASIMDQVAAHLAPLKGKVSVPRSVPGLVSDKLLVMEFLEGVPMTQLADKVKGLSEGMRRAASMRILTRVAEAYGRMILVEGLFQADCHPGNILVGKGGTVGLLDYGQSKLLSPDQRRGFARLIEALNQGGEQEILSAVKGLGIIVTKEDATVVTEMAYGMFDTRGKVDPFDPNSPIKKVGIQTFPKDLFFILRTVQLLRGLKDGMNLPPDFSTAKIWHGHATDALRVPQDEPVLTKPRKRIPAPYMGV